MVPDCSRFRSVASISIAMADVEHSSTVIVSSGKPRRRMSFSKGLFWVAVVLAVLAMGTAYGFNRAFPRSGEAALQYVPDTAGFVTVVDLQPSMGQYLAF